MACRACPALIHSLDYSFWGCEEAMDGAAEQGRTHVQAASVCRYRQKKLQVLLSRMLESAPRRAALCLYFEQRQKDLSNHVVTGLVPSLSTALTTASGDSENSLYTRSTVNQCHFPDAQTKKRPGSPGLLIGGAWPLT